MLSIYCRGYNKFKLPIFITDLNSLSALDISELNSLKYIVYNRFKTPLGVMNIAELPTPPKESVMDIADLQSLKCPI